MEKFDREIPWSDTFLAVGEPEMDGEHQQFIRLLNELNKAIETDDRKTIEQLLNSVLSDATCHFHHEQQLLEKWNYPKAKAHAKRHAELTEQCSRAMKEMREADNDRLWPLRGRQIKQWLFEHLAHDDAEYADFLRERRGSHKTRR